MKITESSGNVFADLGLDNAEKLQARALLGVQVVKLLKAKKKTQKQLGELIGIPQSDVSQLMNAKFDYFSTDKLLELLHRLNQKVTFHITPHKEGEPFHAISS